MTRKAITRTLTDEERAARAKVPRAGCRLRWRVRCRSPYLADPKPRYDLPSGARRVGGVVR